MLKINLFNLLLCAIIISFSSCEEDDTKPANNSTSTNTGANNNNLNVGGSMSAIVNGEVVETNNAAVNVFGGGNTVSVTAVNKVHEDTTVKVKIYVPLDSITGTYSHSDPGFNFSYEVVTFNNESGYTYTRNKESEISITSYDSIGAIADTVYYRVVGNFEFNSKYWANGDSVDVRDGEFDFKYRIWWK